jgi:hypothetical protein
LVFFGWVEDRDADIAALVDYQIVRRWMLLRVKIDLPFGWKIGVSNFILGGYRG